MLLNLKAELIKKGARPILAITNTINCTEKTAYNKLNGGTAFTVPEALAIMDKFFRDDDFSVAYLFANK